MQTAILRIISYRCHIQTQKSGLIAKSHTTSCIDWQPEVLYKNQLYSLNSRHSLEPCRVGEGGWCGSSTSPGFNN
jgi:hypothetical protein